MPDSENTELSNLIIAGNQIRETAKWLVVCLAAIGGVLVAGVQLSSVGSLEPHSERYITAIWAGVLTGLGAASILYGAVLTATKKALPLSALNSDAYIFKDKVLLQGQESLNTLRTNYQDALEQKSKALEANYKMPSQRTRVMADTAQARVEYLDGIVRNVLEVASYHRLLDQWRVSALIISVGAALASVGIAMFAWAANPPESAKATLLSPSVLSTPTNGIVILVEAGQEALHTQLGDTCPLKQPLDSLLLSETSAGPDLIIIEGGCNRTRLILTSTWGTAQSK